MDLIDKGMKEVGGFTYPETDFAISSYFAIYDEVPQSLIQAKNEIKTQGFIGDVKSIGGGKFGFFYDALIDELKLFLKNLVDSEQAKEQAFVSRFERFIRGKDEKLANILQGCLNQTPPDLNAALTYINIYKFNMINNKNKINYDLDEWVARINPYLNKNIKKLATDAINSIMQLNNVEDLTPRQIANYIMEYISTQLMNQGLNAKEVRNFMKSFTKGAEEAFQGMLKEDKDKLNFETQAAKIFYGETDRRRRITEANKDTIKKHLMNKIVRHAFNGLSSEQILVMLGGSGGVSTARQDRILSYYTGKKQLVQTETDVYEIATLNFEPNSEAIKKIIEEYKIADRNFLNFLENIEKDNFIIHYSSKDSSYILSKIEKAEIPNTRIGKVKGSGNLDSRVHILEELGNVDGTIDTKKLIFSMVNAGEYLIYGPGIKSNIERILSALVIGYMFEDFEYMVKDIENSIGELASKGKSGAQLHVYFLTGRFVTMSNLLSRIYAQFSKQKPKKEEQYIKTSFIPAKTSLLKSTESYPLDRWKSVRDQYMQKTKLSIQLLNNVLFEFTGILEDDIEL